jgi:hypothetical protein
VRTQLASLSILALLALTACSNPGASLYTDEPLQSDTEPVYPEVPAQNFDWVTVDGGESNMEFNPQVDILFVTDNSDSMRSAQDNLGKNIELFTRDIMKNRMIDYHIGTISVWDSSERFATTKKDAYGIGELRYVKDRSGQEYSKRYVTKKENGKTLLAPTLQIGIAAYKDGGPEDEEVFAPLAAALDKTGHGAANEEFFRPEAQLVVILMTDSDDKSSLSVQEMVQKLVAAKNGRAEKVTVYGVLARKEDSDSTKDYMLKVHPTYHPECFDFSARKPVKIASKCNDGFGPEKLDQFIVEANAVPGSPADKKKEFIVSIAKDFGKFLGRIGSDISRKTLEKEIALSQRPRVDRETGEINLRVRYGTPAELADGKGQLIPLSGTKGWLYNAQNNSVSLSGDIEYKYSEGARFAVDMIPAL